MASRVRFAPIGVLMCLIAVIGLFGRAKETEFVVFDSTSRENELREKNWDENLGKAYEIGATLFL